MSLNNIINELIVENVKESIKFYEDNFGFETNLTEGKPITWAQLKKDGLIIMLEDYKVVRTSISNFPNKVNNSNLIKFEYSSLEEIKKLYSDFKKRNVSFFMQYTETDYGKAEFGVFDLDKNMILISALI